MKKTISKTLLLLITTLTLLLTISSQTLAKINPKDITGESDITTLGQDYDDQITSITNTISGIGMFIAVGALMIIRHQIHDPVASKKKPTTNEASCPTQ